MAKLTRTGNIVTKVDKEITLKADKQKTFLVTNKNYTFDTPDILDETDISIEMPFLNCFDHTKFLSLASQATLEWVAESLISLLKGFLDKSQILGIPKGYFFQELKRLKSLSRLDLDWTTYEIFLETRINQLTFLPVGFCHGNLILDHLMFDESKLWLLSFKKTFIDCPFIDIAKLLQSLRILTDDKLLKSSLTYIYNVINDEFKEFRNTPGLSELEFLTKLEFVSVKAGPERVKLIEELNLASTQSLSYMR